MSDVRYNCVCRVCGGHKESNINSEAADRFLQRHNLKGGAECTAIAPTKAPTRTYSLDTEHLVKVTETPEKVTGFTGKIDGAQKGSLKPGAKLGLDLLTPQYIEGTAKVMDFGAIKYAPNNWMKGLPISKVIAAAERHLSAIKRGEELDSETGLPHELHASCELMFINWFLHGPNSAEYRAKFDDRQFQEPTSK